MVPVIVGLVVLAVGAVALLARGRRRSLPRKVVIDPFTLSEPWRRHVAAAQATQRRYREIARTTPDGPLRDRLREIDTQVDHAVAECFGIARRGDDLDDALKRFDTGALGRQLENASDEPTRASVQSQLASAARIRTTRNDTDARLRLLTTRMGELVAQAAEVSVGTDTTEQLGTGVEEVVTQLEALRLALNDVNDNDVNDNDVNDNDVNVNDNDVNVNDNDVNVNDNDVNDNDVNDNDNDVNDNDSDVNVNDNDNDNDPGRSAASP